GVKVRRLDAAEDVEHRGFVVARAERLDLTVTEQVANLGQLLSVLERRGIVGVEIVAVGAMERVQVPQRRMVTRGDYFQRLGVAGRNEGTARFALVKELFLGDLACLRVMRDENNFDVAVAGRDELVEQEEEAAREVLLHRVHRARRVHDADYRGVRFLLGVDFDVLVAQVVLMEREAPADALECSGAGRTGERVFVQRAFLERDLVKRAFNVVIGIDFAVSLRFFQRALDRLVALVGREHAHHALLGGAPLVEPDADTDLAVAFSPRRVVGLDFAQRAPLEVGQFEILEHDLDQFLERDVGLVIVNARPVAGALVAFAGAVLAGFADDLPGPRVAVTLRRAGRVVAEDETVFLDSAQRNLDDAVPVFADDRFFGD